MGVDFLESGVPDASTLLKFRRMLEKKGLHQQFWVELRHRLAQSNQILRPGTMIDPALVHVVTSTETWGKKLHHDPNQQPEVVQLEMQ